MEEKKDKIQINKVVEKASANEIEKISIEKFDWKSDILNYCSDMQLKIVLLLVQRNCIKELFFEKNNKTNITSFVLVNKIITLCDTKYNDEELLQAIVSDNNCFPDGTSLFGDNFRTFKRIATVNKMCYEKCNFSKCYKTILAYVYYLISKNLLDKALEERNNFRLNNKLNDYFEFNLNYKKILTMCSDELFNYANEMVEKKLLYIDTCCENNNYQVYSKITCSDILADNLDASNLEKYVMNVFSNRFRNNCSNPELICQNYSCHLKGCPVLVASAIYYLKRSGNAELINECRNEYHKSREKFDLAIEVEQNKILSSLGEKQLETFNILDKYKSVIPNINDVGVNINNIKQNDLHLAIECDDYSECNLLINDIASLLFKNKKIVANKKNVLSLRNFAMQSVSLSESKTFNQKFLVNSIFSNQLVVLNEIDDFISYYKVCCAEKNFGLYNESRHKQVENVFQLLTAFNKNNYIILLGSHEEIDSLLDLNQKIGFCYKQNILKYPSLSFDELFDLYTSKLNGNLLETVRYDKLNYKNQFIDYISMNERFFPFSKRDLCLYLADYSNKNNRIEFPDNIYNKETTSEALSNIIGLQSVKNNIIKFENYMLYQARAKGFGIRPSNLNMHMIFTGNPGTGKTTIARIMAKMLYDLGIIKSNKLIEVGRNDLVAGYSGQTALKTFDVIQKAKGGVLFIDEAYSLASDNYGAEAISIIIKEMEDHKDDLVVIFAGYEKEMQDFLNTNSGIASRIGYTFKFEDYSSDELLDIFKLKIKNLGYTISDDALLKVNELCNYFSKRKDFGNGRFVDKLVQETIMKHSTECKNITEFDEIDIPSIEEINNSNFDSKDNKDASQLLDDIVGMEELKKKILDFQSYVKFISDAKKSGITIQKQNMHMIFAGNPGTGKTTVARIMAKILFDMGILHENKLIEVEKKDLVAEYVGQTGIKTQKVIDLAMGGVLFVDEAYTLVEGSKNGFGSEAIATLITAMENHKDDLVVIFAGYTNEMRDFLNINPGIASRIGYTFNFTDYSDKELDEIFYRKMANNGFSLSDEAKMAVDEVMKYFQNVENIGNGRFVDKIYQETIMKHSKNYSLSNINLISKDDVPSIKEVTSLLLNGDQMIDVNNITDDDKRKTAIHEVGHALVRYLLFKDPNIKKITINAEGTGTLGYVQYKNEKFKYTLSKKEMLNFVQSHFGGLCNEEVFYGFYENGCSSDLESSTRMVKMMVTKYGMSDLGYMVIGENDGTSMVILNEVNKILNEVHDKTIELLSQYKDKSVKIVNYLLEHGEITEEEFIEQFNS